MLYRNHWLKIVSLSLVVVLTLGFVASAGIARADDGTSTPTPTAPAPSTPEPTGQATATGLGGILRNVMNALLDAAASNTGVDAATLRKELPGKTLADVIKAHNGDVDKVKAAAKATLTTQINQAVSDGKITQDQANRLLNRLDTALDRFLNTPWPGGNNGNNRQSRMIAMLGLQILIRETATEANISQRELLQELRSGKTLSQIATEHNADPAKIVSAAVTTATNRINSMVKSGRISQDQANQLIAGLQTSFTDLMNKANPLTGFGNGFGNQPRRPGGLFGGIFGWLFGGRNRNRGNHNGNGGSGASSTPEPTLTPAATATLTGQSS